MELVHAQANALGFDISESIENGSALQEFKSMLERQGVEPALAQQLLDDPWSVLHVRLNNTLLAEQSGFVADLDALLASSV